MTIIINTHSFSGYPVRALDSVFAQHLRDAMPAWSGTSDAIVLRLEAFLQSTGRVLNAGHLGTEHAKTIFRQFLALLYINLMAQGRAKTAYTYFVRLRSALRNLGDKSLDDFYIPYQASPDEGLAVLASQAEALSIPERVSFWRGWTAKNAAGKEVVFRFYPMYDRLGAEFTQEFFRICADAVSRGRSYNIPCANELAAYIGSYEGEITALHFKEDPGWLWTFLKEFSIHLVAAAHSRANQVYATTRRWSKCAHFLESSVLGKIWTKPSRRLARPKAPPLQGADTRIVLGEDGVEVRHVLMTEVPLTVTDSEAKEILFKSIRFDLELIKQWARKDIADAWERHKRRLDIASRGTVSTPGEPGKNTGLDWRLSRASCPDWLAHAAATFESRGFIGSDQRPIPSAYYPQPLQETTWDLGLPTPNLLLAHASVLIADHPQITSSFLEHLELFDKNGCICGFVTTDAGHYLVGAKRRKGSENAEQQIKLNEETTEVVRQVIELTNPLRQHLKEKGDPSWRRLFLASPSVGAKPKFWFAAGVSSRAALWLSGRLIHCADAEANYAWALAKNFTLRSLRASAAVLVYLETGSIQKFSEALGHERCDPILLDSYLPRPVQEWFVERWIRLFQTGLVVRVMRGSSQLLRASGFTSMDELDRFLENHAIRKIPSHLQVPDYLENFPDDADGSDSRIVFGLDQQVLTAMVSLNLAVRATPDEACGRALRWSAICNRLVDHIETQNEQPELIELLAEARAAANPDAMREVLRG